MVCFDNKVLRGNRTTKFDAGALDAYITPNFPPIATVEIEIKGYLQCNAILLQCVTYHVEI